MKGEIISNASEVPCLGEEMRARIDCGEGQSWELSTGRQGRAAMAVRERVRESLCDDAGK